MGDSHCQLAHAQANGNVLFHVEDGDVLNAAANNDEHNAHSNGNVLFHVEDGDMLNTTVNNDEHNAQANGNVMFHVEVGDMLNITANNDEHNAQANGNVLFHVEDGDMLNAASINDEHNAQGAALSPVTPILCRQRESRDSVSLATTPLSVEPLRPPNAHAFNSTRNEKVLGSGSGSGSDLDASPRTPAHGVFDPFTPGPDHNLAPVPKKVVKKSQKTVVRRLDFDDISECSSSRSDDYEDADNMILKSMFETLLEAIISKQTEEFYVENQFLELEVTHTPISSPRLTGVSDTCPAAPVKAVVSKSKNKIIDPEICKKLEF